MAGLQHKSSIFLSLPKAVSPSRPQALLVSLPLILPAALGVGSATGGATSDWCGKGGGVQGLC